MLVGNITEPTLLYGERQRKDYVSLF